MRLKRVLMSRVWIWLVVAAALAFVARGVTLIVSASREQAEVRGLEGLIDRLNGLERSVRDLEKGITPVEFLPGEHSESALWGRLLDQYHLQAQWLRDTGPAVSEIKRCLSASDASVRRLADVHREVLEARFASGDARVLEVQYQREIRLAADAVRTAAASLRDRLALLSRALGNRWRQLSLLVWVSCVVSLLAVVLSAMYRRDLARRRIAEEALARVRAELEMRVEERTAELSRTNAMLIEQVRERQRAEERLERYASELARSNAELQQFAYVASHDLQEPLRMVSSYVQLLARRYGERLDSDADEFIRYAVDGAERMKQLILDLLTYARVDSQQKAFEQVDCSEILGDVLQNLKVAIEESQAEIVAGALPEVMADPTQIAQLLQNLIANAIKFRGEVSPRIEIAAARHGNEHVFRVRDNGVGIDPAHHDRIFRVFQRLQPRSTHSGTGIGLAICKKIAERHGGRIWVESEVGRGTTIYFSLPEKAKAFFGSAPSSVAVEAQA